MGLGRSGQLRRELLNALLLSRSHHDQPVAARRGLSLFHSIRGRMVAGATVVAQLSAMPFSNGSTRGRPPSASRRNSRTASRMILLTRTEFEA